MCCKFIFRKLFSGFFNKFKGLPVFSAGAAAKLRNDESCVRCNNVIDPSNGKRWEFGWPLYGSIQLGFAAQIFAKLADARGCADNEHFKWWKEGHAALIKNEAQEVIFDWGQNSKSKCLLCYECQSKLINMVGEFFGIPKRVGEIKKEISGSTETA